MGKEAVVIAVAGAGDGAETKAGFGAETKAGSGAEAKAGVEVEVNLYNSIW